MNTDIFEALDKAGFGSNVHEVAAQGECRVLRLEDETGEGFMTMYRVFDGVYLMYNDFHLRKCVSEYQNAETVLCVDHCREGRIEHENPDGCRYYMEAGDIRIDTRVHHAGRVSLPLSHYHGISLGFIKGAADESLKNELPFLSLSLKSIAGKFCPDSKEFLLRDCEQLQTVFSQLYHPPKTNKLEFFKVKTAELLLLLSETDARSHTKQRQYFPAKQTDKIKQMHELMTGSLDRSFTVEQLSERFDMPQATLRKVFRAVYGVPVYQYIKNYKMNAAASLLISDPTLTVSDIAQRMGYDNASKFSAAFRDVMGSSPQEYRTKEET